MKNMLKKGVVLLTLASHSFAALPMDDYAIWYVAAPIAVAIIMNCAGGRVGHNNDLEDPEVQERVLRQVRITRDQAENLLWQVNQNQEVQEEVRLRRVQRENRRLGRTVLSCQSAKTNKRKS